MKIHSVSRIHHPLEKVYQVYRDRLPEIAAYIPDIKEIVVTSREDTPIGPKIVNEWIADREIPKIAQRIIRPEMVRWDDYAQWNDSEHHVDWRLGIRAFPSRVRCGGRNAFFADGERATRVVLSGDLELDLKNLPGVPRLLAGKITPAVEDFIVKLVTPNLERVNQSLERFIDDLA